LSVFRRVENWLPSEFYAHHHLRFRRDKVMAEDELRRTVGSHGFSIANLHTRLIDDGRFFEYRMVIRSRDRRGAQALSEDLLRRPEVIEFRISPTGDWRHRATREPRTLPCVLAAVNFSGERSWLTTSMHGRNAPPMPHGPP
jgi:hypothetical protein